MGHNQLGKRWSLMSAQTDKCNYSMTQATAAIISIIAASQIYSA